MEFFYNPVIRRWIRRALFTFIAIWLVMLVLGVEVLIGTVHTQGYGEYPAPYQPGNYTCTYWTGAGFRYQIEDEYGFSACPVWRWGRQIAD